jgi:hypothetical protein
MELQTLHLPQFVLFTLGAGPGLRRMSSGHVAWFDDGWHFAHARAPARATDFGAARCSDRFDHEGDAGAKTGQDCGQACCSCSVYHGWGLLLVTLALC